MVLSKKKKIHSYQIPYSGTIWGQHEVSYTSFLSHRPCFWTSKKQSIRTSKLLSGSNKSARITYGDLMVCFVILSAIAQLVIVSQKHVIRGTIEICRILEIKEKGQMKTTGLMLLNCHRKIKSNVLWVSASRSVLDRKATCN